MTTAVAAPFRFFSLQVVRTRRLSPSLVRVTFAGDELREFHSLGCDQSLSLFIPHPGQDAPVERVGGWGRSCVPLGHCLTLPALSPDCQNRCRPRNATMMGMIVSREPVITRL